MNPISLLLYLFQTFKNTKRRSQERLQCCKAQSLAFFKWREIKGSKDSTISREAVLRVVYRETRPALFAGRVSTDTTRNTVKTDKPWIDPFLWLRFSG